MLNLTSGITFNFIVWPIGKISHRAFTSNNIKIVSEDEIIKAVNEKAAGTLILHKVGPGKDKASGYCFKMLIGTDDSDMYYYNQHKIDKDNPDGLLALDLKRIIRWFMVQQRRINHVFYTGTVDQIRLLTKALFKLYFFDHCLGY